MELVHEACLLIRLADMDLHDTICVEAFRTLNVLDLVDGGFTVFHQSPFPLISDSSLVLGGVQRAPDVAEINNTTDWDVGMNAQSKISDPSPVDLHYTSWLVLKKMRRVVTLGHYLVSSRYKACKSCDYFARTNWKMRYPMTNRIPTRISFSQRSNFIWFSFYEMNRSIFIAGIRTATLTQRYP